MVIDRRDNSDWPRTSAHGCSSTWLRDTTDRSCGHSGGTRGHGGQRYKLYRGGRPICWIGDEVRGLVEERTGESGEKGEMGRGEDGDVR